MSLFNCRRVQRKYYLSWKQLNIDHRAGVWLVSVQNSLLVWTLWLIILLPRFFSQHTLVTPIFHAHETRDLAEGRRDAGLPSFQPTQIRPHSALLSRSHIVQHFVHKHHTICYSFANWNPLFLTEAIENLLLCSYWLLDFNSNQLYTHTHTDIHNSLKCWHKATSFERGCKLTPVFNRQKWRY